MNYIRLNLELIFVNFFMESDEEVNFWNSFDNVWV